MLCRLSNKLEKGKKQREKWHKFKPIANLNNEFSIHCTLLLRFLFQQFFV